MTVSTHVYAEPDGGALLGDFFAPEGPAPFPLLLAIPGGGWRFGARANFSAWGDYLSARGYGFFAIDHRRTTNGPCFPEAVQDVCAALRWLAGNAPSFGGDPSRIGILGSSAGAHLGSLAALAGEDFGPAGATPLPAIRAMVLAYGVYDLHAHWQVCRGENTAPGDDFTERFLGCTPYDDPMLYVRASPLRHVRYARNRTATFLIWGTHDEAVSPQQSESFRLALQQARFLVRDCPVVGAGHFWFSDDPIDDLQGHTAYVAPRIVRFLDRHLRAAAPLSALDHKG